MIDVTDLAQSSFSASAMLAGSTYSFEVAILE